MEFIISDLGNLSEWHTTAYAVINTRSWRRVLEAEQGTSDINKLLKEEYDRLQSRRTTFAEGEIVAYAEGDLSEVPLGIIGSLRINAKTLDDVPVKWHDVTGKGYYTTHVPNGNMLVCASIAIDNTIPTKLKEALKSQGISTFDELVQAQLALARDLNVDRMIAYSRPTTYGAYTAKLGHMEMDEYLKKVEQRLIHEPAIGGHFRNGAKFGKIIPNGRPLDPESLGYNVIMDYSHLL